MRVAMKSHALPVYKKNRIASLLCIFETIVLNFKQLRCKVIQINVLKHCYAFLIHLLENIFILRM